MEETAKCQFSLIKQTHEEKEPLKGQVTPHPPKKIKPFTLIMFKIISFSFQIIKTDIVENILVLFLTLKGNLSFKLQNRP